MSTLCYSCDKVIEERSDIRYVTNHTDLEDSNGMRCCLDFEAFKGIIKEDCVVEYSFNGESFECSGEQFVDRLKEGHFENTTKCEAINFKLHRDHEIENYHVCDETLYTRLGLGKYEDGPGVYYMRSEGFVTFENGKVVKLIMQFEKKKTLK